MHDLLQELKTHPRIRRILDGGERVQWGAKTIPGGRLRRAAEAVPRAGPAPGGRRRRPRERAGAEGDPLRDRVGPARGRGGVADARARRARARRRSRRTTTSLRESFIWSDLREVRNMRQAFGRGFYVGGALAGAMTATKGKFPPGDARDRARRRADADLQTDRAESYPAPDGKLTFDKLSSVFASGNRTRDDQPNHIRIADEGPARARGDVGAHVPGAGLRGRRRRRRRHRRGEARPVELRPVRRDHRQGRPPDPPEGGSGPEYTLT